MVETMGTFMEEVKISIFVGILLLVIEKVYSYRGKKFEDDWLRRNFVMRVY